MAKEKTIGINWILKMAWRDSRRNRSRLLLFISSIILGIAALVAIYSLSDNLQDEIDNQAASLLGADLELTTNRIVEPHIKSFIDSLGKERSEERRFASMIYFQKTFDSRLVQVRALGGQFPYYGELETIPAIAARSFRNGKYALVDQTLMVQYNAKVGDTIRIGILSFTIAGTLMGAPGQSGISASVSPVVYIPLTYLNETGLEQKGSRITYRYYYKYPKNFKVQNLVDNIETRLDTEGFRYDTVASQKEDSSRSFKDVTKFLSLISFIALLLGCIGVASAIHIYVKEKISTIAILRCLGAKSSQAFLIYLLQIAGIGLFGSLIGVVLGTVIQQFLPIVLSDLLPIEITTSISWKAIGEGLLLGLVISILFALTPLVSIRKISPLNTLRVSYQATLIKDPLKWIVYGVIFLFILGFTYWQLGGIQEAVFFTLGILLSFAALYGIAVFLTRLVRKFFPNKASYLWRQGLANLYRPNNQTSILVISIGLGTALICTLFFVQSILLNRVTLSASNDRPNMVLFDIQPNQKDSVIELAKVRGLKADGTVPIVNMRLIKLKDITPEILAKDSTIKMQSWIFNWEYRVTFRDSLTDSEKITNGKWLGDYSGQGAVPISIEKGFAERNKLKLGDTMIFNVQGLPLTTRISSFREVDWNRVQTNFLVLFPTGVLEKAPQFHVFMTRVPSVEVSAAFQKDVVEQFPNVSIIDLGLIISVLNEILDKIGFVIQFMAAFSIITGLVVLIASVLISKYQRMQESVLLRTLGASGRQIFAITALEYFFLGALASITGIGLALAGSWALANYSFETPFTPEILPIIVIFISVCILTIAIGLFNSISVLTKPPLEILRQDIG